MPALYYPFHLCHERTLHRLLDDHDVVHFRDFMSLRLTPLTGTMAFPDRMGDYYPELLNSGRIVQGYDVSGALDAKVMDTVNRDLEDRSWRVIFHESLQRHYRFQRGLFDAAQFIRDRKRESESPSIFSELVQDYWVDQPFDVERVRRLSQTAMSTEDGPSFEYGWALVKTSAALAYTLRLCQQLDLLAVTDSSSHHRLFTRTCQRDHQSLPHSCLSQEGD